ncbi:MAG: Txe/YoeB family addiction module toxin [Verrucomicrobiota bacterium]|nr:Txe/YoeB family addiction module toxin [Verrucomicrobiota bacterium]
MELGIEAKFLEDLSSWVSANPRTASRILNLVEQVQRDPFRGIGKPEPLRFLGSDLWSRRITEEHRLVYKVTAGRVVLLQCRYHY